MALISLWHIEGNLICGIRKYAGVYIYHVHLCTAGLCLVTSVCVCMCVYYVYDLHKKISKRNLADVGMTQNALADKQEVPHTHTIPI